MKFKADLIAFSAPSGAGKTTIVRKLAQKYPQMVISISATTRAKRPNERDGNDYFFLTHSEFEQAIKRDAFLEYEEVFGNYYGTLKSTVEDFRRQGKIVLFDIDVHGALAIKKHDPEALLIFIKPPSKEELIRRLKGRKSESEESIKKRLERLEYEFEKAGEFDHIIVNDDLETAFREIESLISVCL